MICYTSRHRIPFQVDAEDLEWISLYTWRIASGGYPCTNLPDTNFPTPLHVFLMGKAPVGFEWDHIDRDKLNNQKENFRLVTSQQNHGNVIRQSNPRGFRGIGFYANKWTAHITVKGKRTKIGKFDSKEEAIAARKEAELLHWGFNLE